MIGLASDMFSAWLLNQLVAKATGYAPGEVYMHIDSAHIYAEHLEKAKEQLSRKPLISEVSYRLDFNSLQEWDLELKGYASHPPIKYELKV